MSASACRRHRPYTPARLRERHRCVMIATHGAEGSRPRSVEHDRPKPAAFLRRDHAVMRRDPTGQYPIGRDARMKSFIARRLRPVFSSATTLPSGARHRDPMVARDDRAEQRRGRQARRGFQQVAERLQGRAGYKGSYADTLNAGIAAYRAGNAPHIIQVFEVGTATMMAAKGAIKPVFQLMKDAGEPFDPNSYLPAITGYYSTVEGRDAVLPVQLLEHGDVGQHGRLEEGRDRRRPPAEDLARSVRGRRRSCTRRARPAASRRAGSPGR